MCASLQKPKFQLHVFSRDEQKEDQLLGGRALAQPLEEIKRVLLAIGIHKKERRLFGVYAVERFAVQRSWGCAKPRILKCCYQPGLIFLQAANNKNAVSIQYTSLDC